MPVDPPVIPRAPGWTVGAAGIVLVMAFIAFQTIIHAGHPNGYAGRHWQPGVPWPYPTDDVVTWLSIMASEGLMICLVLRSRMKGSLTARSLVLAVGMFMVMVLLAPLGMHASSPFTEHLGWMVLATAWLVVFAIGSGIANVVRARLARERAMADQHRRPAVHSAQIDRPAHQVEPVR